MRGFRGVVNTMETPKDSHLARERGKTEGKSTASMAMMVMSIICALYMLRPASLGPSGTDSLEGGVLVGRGCVLLCLRGSRRSKRREGRKRYKLNLLGDSAYNVWQSRRGSISTVHSEMKLFRQAVEPSRVCKVVCKNTEAWGL